MPRRSIRCVVDLDLHAVTAPGCWLPSKEDCYISVSFFSQYKNTEVLGSVFPIPVNEHFRFEKTYFTALEAEEVIELLEDELVVIELLQMSEYSDGAVHLATYTNNVRDFLYPFETYKRVFQARDRDIFLDRTVAFPGISPKLEFSSKIVVKESYSDELDAIEDAIDYHKNTLKRLRKAKLVKRRPRSCSPRRRSDEDDIRDNPGRNGMGRRGMDDFSVNYNGNPNYAKPRPGTKHLMSNGPPIPDGRDYRTFTKSRPSGYILPHLTAADVEYSQDSDDDNESFVTEDSDVIPAGTGVPRRGKSSKTGLRPKTGTSRPSSSTRPSRPRTRGSKVSTKAKPSSLYPTNGEGKLSTPRRSGSARPALKRRANSTPRSQGLNSGRSDEDPPFNTPRKLSRDPVSSTRYPRPPSREKPSLHGRSPRKNQSSTPRHRSAERPSSTRRSPLREIPVNSSRYPSGGNPGHIPGNPYQRGRNPDYPVNGSYPSSSPIVPSRRQISRQRPLSPQSNPSGVFHTVPLIDPNNGRPLSTPRQPRQGGIYPQDARYPPYDSALPHYQGKSPYNNAIPQYRGGSPYNSGAPQYPGAPPYATDIPQYPGGSPYDSGVPQYPGGPQNNASMPYYPGAVPQNAAQYPGAVPGNPAQYPGAVPGNPAQYPGGLPYNTSVPGRPGQLPQMTIPNYPDGTPYTAVPKQSGLPYTVRRKPQGLSYTNRPGVVGPQISPKGVTQVIDPVRRNRSLSPRHRPLSGGRSPRVRINTSPSPSRSPSANVANHKLGRNVVSHYAKEPYSYSLSRSPSPTLQQRIEDMNLTNEMDGRPPFVVRKLDDSLIGRIPVGLGPEQIAKSKPHKCVRTNKYKTVDFEDYYSLPGVNNRSPRPKSSLSRRSPPGVLYGFDPDDEVANLTSRGRSLPRKRDTLSPTRRYRSPSPVRNTPSYSPPRSRRDLYDRVPNVRISRDLSPDDIYYGRDVSPTNSLDSDDVNNRKRPGSNPNKTSNIRKKTPQPSGLGKVVPNGLPKTPRANKSAKLPSPRRANSSPYSRLGKTNKPSTSADRSPLRSKSPYGTRKKIPSDLSRRPYASDTETPKSGRRMRSPYGSDIETPRPRRRITSPYGSDIDNPRPRRRITSPYGSDTETPRPRQRITSPYGSDIDNPRPRRGITSPYGSDTDTPRPRRRITSPYGSDDETSRPCQRITSPYGSDIETPRPRRRITSPYGSDTETPRPRQRITNPYTSDDEILGPSQRLTSPPLSDTELGSPQRQRVRPYANGNRTPRGGTSPYDTDSETGKPSRRVRTSPYASDAGTSRPRARSPYGTDIRTPRSRPRSKSPYADPETSRPRARSPYPSDIRTPRSRMRSKSPYASDPETSRPRKRSKSPYRRRGASPRTKTSKTPTKDLLRDPYAMDARPDGRAPGPLSGDIPASLRGRTSPDLDLDEPYHRSRYSYPELSSDHPNRSSPYASDSALPSKFGRGTNPRDNLDNFSEPRRRPYASDTERPGKDIDLDEIIGRKRSPFRDDLDRPLESDRLAKRSPSFDYLGPSPSRRSQSPNRAGGPSDFDRHSFDDNPDRPYRYGGYGSPFSDRGHSVRDLESRTSGHEYRQLTRTLTEGFDISRQQDRTLDFRPLKKSRYAQSPDSGLADEFDRKVTLSDDVDDMGSITITEGSLDINISDSDLGMDTAGGPVTREDKYKVSHSTKNKKLLGTKKKLGRKVKSSVKKSVDKDPEPDASKGTTTKSVTRKITKSTTITRTYGGKKSLGTSKKTKSTPRISKTSDYLMTPRGKSTGKRITSAKRSKDDLDMDLYRQTHSPPPYSSPQHHRSPADILPSSHKTTRADVYHNTPETFRADRSESPLPSRPVSPVLNRTRFRDRFSEAPFFSASSKLSERAVERSHRYRYPTHDALDDLALDTSLAKYRRYSPMYS